MSIKRIIDYLQNHLLTGWDVTPTNPDMLPMVVDKSNNLPVKRESNRQLMRRLKKETAVIKRDHEADMGIAIVEDIDSDIDDHGGDNEPIECRDGGQIMKYQGYFGSVRDLVPKEKTELKGRILIYNPAEKVDFTERLPAGIAAWDDISDAELDHRLKVLNNVQTMADRRSELISQEYMNRAMVHDIQSGHGGRHAYKYAVLKNSLCRERKSCNNLI